MKNTILAFALAIMFIIAGFNLSYAKVNVTRSTAKIEKVSFSKRRVVRRHIRRHGKHIRVVKRTTKRVVIKHS